MAKEEEIVRKIKQGDRAAFDKLCSDLYPSILAYACMFMPRYEAEDIVQDVLFSVWVKRENFNEHCSPRFYIFRSVYNRALNHLKRENLSATYRDWNKNRISFYEHEAADPDKNPIIRKLFDGDLRKNLNEAIESLPPKCREVFRLSFIEEKSNKEIAEELGISVRTVEGHINTALKKLRACLGEDRLALFLLLYFHHLLG